MPNIQFRIDKQTKKESKKIFEKLGLDMSTAIKLFLRQTILHNGLPFPLGVEKELVPRLEINSKKAGNNKIESDQASPEKYLIKRKERKLPFEGTITKGGRNTYSFLNFHKKVVEDFPRDLEKIKVQYKDDFFLTNANNLFWNYKQVDNRKIEEWSGNRYARVELNLDELDRGLIIITSISF